ncbi:MAG: hypothetical protein FWC27_04360 [Firmicutes bacterium]|nr:hypothetical protein [Bacillota bacterium]
MLKVAAWIVGIGGALAMIGKYVVGPLRRGLKRIKDIDRHTTENYMATLRLEVWMKELPLAERVDAGKEYLALGGNGATRARHAQNVESLKAEVRKSG